jgi:hypothetical protein
MAPSDLITRYLAELRDSLAGRPDADDLVSEVADHLHCAATDLRVGGRDVESAQREVLDRFGDATLVARSLSATTSGGWVMPTRLTRTAGTFALIGSIVWLVAAPASLVGAGSEVSDAHYYTVALVAFIASACTTVALFGLLRRAGGTKDVLSVVAMLLAVLGTVTLGVATWAWIIGVGLLTLAALATVLALRSARLGPTIGSILLAGAWPVGIAIALILDSARFGRIDTYGDAYVAQLIGFATGSILFSVALFLQGRWLRRERVVDPSIPMAIA